MKHLLCALLLASGAAWAQAPAAPASDAAAPAAAVAAPVPAAVGAVKSQNIFDVKPDASEEPG